MQLKVQIAPGLVSLEDSYRRSGITNCCVRAADPYCLVPIWVFYIGDTFGSLDVGSRSRRIALREVRSRYHRQRRSLLASG
jgi:hypothetical protein